MLKINTLYGYEVKNWEAVKRLLGDEKSNWHKAQQKYFRQHARRQQRDAERQAQIENRTREEAKYQLERDIRNFRRIRNPHYFDPADYIRTDPFGREWYIAPPSYLAKEWQEEARAYMNMYTKRRNNKLENDRVARFMEMRDYYRRQEIKFAEEHEKEKKLWYKMVFHIDPDHPDRKIISPNYFNKYYLPSFYQFVQILATHTYVEICSWRNAIYGVEEEIPGAGPCLPLEEHNLEFREFPYRADYQWSAERITNYEEYHLYLTEALMYGLNRKERLLQLRMAQQRRWIPKSIDPHNIAQVEAYFQRQGLSWRKTYIPTSNNFPLESQCKKWGDYFGMLIEVANNGFIYPLLEPNPQKWGNDIAYPEFTEKHPEFRNCLNTSNTPRK